MSTSKMLSAVVLPGPDGVFTLLRVGEPAPDWLPDDYKHLAGASAEKTSRASSSPKKAEAKAASKPAPEDAPTAEEPASEEAPVPADEAPKMPSKVGGSLADWQAYARALGATEGDLDGKTRNQLRNEFGD